MDTKIDITTEKGPFKAQLKVGGGFPITWVLYDYQREGTGWTRSHVGSGQGTAWIDLPHADAAAMRDHVFTWSVAAVDFDATPMEVDVVVTIKGTDPNSPGGVKKGKWAISASQPRTYVSVRVDP